MAKKIKRKPTEGRPYVDPNLEVVGEERAFEIELDEETNEVLMVHHYRRTWGDDFDADIEHGLNVDETKALIGVLLEMLQVIQNNANDLLVQKSTPVPIEGNPLQGPNNIEGA